ncbi:hypothetical protein H2204_008839 [Knufia peltigerae]|uniref:Uncharacterized protein n=1 Tax=Knufia peltigerae TaxID=1002370 RepID=A0AA39CVK3_9EURO|nr:hypothetical protein H2204_008839 [Knufia peltigerae]
MEGGARPSTILVTNHIDDIHKSNENLEHMEILEGDVDASISNRVRHKFDRNIIPWLWGLWMFSFLDRSNIGNANIAGLSDDLNLHSTQYNMALMLFFIPYILVDLPSNWILKYFQAGWYLAGLVTCWGIIMVMAARRELKLTNYK